MIMVHQIIGLEPELVSRIGFISQELCDFKPKIVTANKQDLAFLKVDMQQFFKAVLMAPDRGDAMIHLAGTFGDLVRMTDPEGDYS